MTRILLADDSPHAQRMGERILRDEGFEVVSLTDGHAAMVRLADVDPDLILADVFLPGKSGFELCRHVKAEPRFKHVRVVLTAGLLEPFDEDEAKRAGCDAILKKPFEAAKVVSTIEPLVKEARLARASSTAAAVETAQVPEPPPTITVELPVMADLFAAAAPAPKIEELPAAPVEPPSQPAVTAAPPSNTELAAPTNTPALAPSVEPAPHEPVATLATAASEVPPIDPTASELDPERVRAAVTIALDAALPALIQEITERVLIALGH